MRSPVFARAVLLIAGATATLLLAACAAVVSPGPSPSQNRAAVDPGAEGKVVPLPPPAPLDAFSGVAEQDLIRQAAAILTDECLRDFGFEPRPRSGTGPQPAEPYALDARNGYRPSAEVQAWRDAAEVLNAEAGRDLPSDAYTLVLTGGNSWKLGDPRPTHPVAHVEGRPVPVGGCEGQATATLAAGDPYNTPLRGFGIAPKLVADLATESGALVDADPRMAALTQRWSDCMRTRGFDYANPQDAAAGTSTSAAAAAAPGAPPPAASWNPSGPASQEELATAQADVSCQIELGYQDALGEIRDDHQRRLIEDNQLALDEIRVAQERFARNAIALSQGTR